jgi:hypothetical protein
MAELKTFWGFGEMSAVYPLIDKLLPVDRYEPINIIVSEIPDGRLLVQCFYKERVQ